MNFLDSHFHLDLWKDPRRILKEIESNKIYTIAITNAPSVFKQTQELTKDSKYVRAALGLHPELVKERFREIKYFHDYVKTTKYIGEVGLDYVQGTVEEKQLQRKIFSEIISECYSAVGKVLTIHSRRAEDDVITIIGNDFPGTAIFHWYSGPLKLLNKAIDSGAYFSVNLAMTLSNNGKKIIAEIPNERLLTESDGPFVSDKGLPCSPLDIEKVVNNLAELKQTDPLQLKNLIYSNFNKALKH